MSLLYRAIYLAARFRDGGRRGKGREEEEGPFGHIFGCAPTHVPRGAEKRGKQWGRRGLSPGKGGIAERKKKPWEADQRHITYFCLCFRNPFSRGREKRENQMHFSPILDSAPHFFLREYFHFFGRVSLHLRPLFASEEEHFPSE